MGRELPISNEIYHIYNRGVDKRDIFLDDSDRLRFIRSLVEFNNSNPSPKYFPEVQLPNEEWPYSNKEPLVELMVFCLMNNHFHFLVRQKQERGVSEFMRKIGTGYTNYFNGRYQRSGSLFEGKYKMVHVVDNVHFVHLPYYIHLNPLDIKFPKWRERKINNYKEAMNFLEKYRWSSFPDYIGIKNFPLVTQRSFIHSFFDNDPVIYKKEITAWLKDFDVEPISCLIID